jgi:hypothetical protein
LQHPKLAKSSRPFSGMAKPIRRRVVSPPRKRQMSHQVPHQQVWRKKKCFFHFFAPRKIKEIKKNQYPFLKFHIDFGPACVRFELLLAQAVVRVDQPS